MNDRVRRDVVNRLKSGRGHIDAVLRMVESDVYCPEIIKQLAAVQGSLERASRLMLRNHIETCVVEAVRAGRTEEIIYELMEALRFDHVATGPDRTPPAAAAPTQLTTPRKEKSA